MKKNSWILFAIAANAVLLPAACGSKSSTTSTTTGTSSTTGAGGGSGGGSTTSTTGTTSTSSTTTTTTTGAGGGGVGGGAMDCTGLSNGSDCGLCVEEKACPEFFACTNDTDCNDCLMGAGTGCDMNDLLTALNDAITANCDMECTAKSACNPVTNEGCTGAGEACDLNGSGVFVCFGPPNDALVCAACSNQNGPFCAPGMHCNEDANGGQCTHYCCNDGDCGTGTCDMASLMLPNGVGVCVGMGDAGATLASCDAPAVSPSMGTCFTP
ncbi:MAG: hypothetical protein ABI193_12520 [Minicystis sp.]